MQKECPLPMRKLATSLRTALKVLPKSGTPLPSKVEINWISQKEMSRVHQEFMNDASLTDVITFHHGEILICPKVALQQAKAHGHSYEQELLFYALHGLLHLLGWNDHSTADRNKMHREQSRIMRVLSGKC